MFGSKRTKSFKKNISFQYPELLGKEGQDLLLRIISDEKKNIKPTAKELAEINAIVERKLRKRQKIDDSMQLNVGLANSIRNQSLDSERLLNSFFQYRFVNFLLSLIGEVPSRSLARRTS
jgi:hypothetical protein